MRFWSVTTDSIMDNRQNKIKQLAGYLKKNPDDTFSKFALALELIKQNDVFKARVLFESVLESDPDYIGVYYHLGKLYELIGQPDRAFEIYQIGISKTADSEYQRTRRELEEALEQLNEELRKDELS